VSCQEVLFNDDDDYNNAYDNDADDNDDGR
jgi:hypothetical protein